MGSRGPAPKIPVAIAFALGVPEPDEKLNDEAKTIYRFARDVCKEAGRELQKPDVAILEIYAQTLADYWNLDARCRKEEAVISSPNGAMQINPWFKLRADAFKQAAVAMAKLGFSPADRIRLNAGGHKTKSGAADPLADY